MTDLRVLLIERDSERAAILKSALRAAGYLAFACDAATLNLLAQVRAVQPDVIVIDREAPDRDTLEHVCLLTRDEPRPVVLFTDNGDAAQIRAAVKAGVSAYVVGGLEAERVRPIVEAARARFEELHALRSELDRMKAALAERKRIERAKGIVMTQRGCSEAEAYAALRRLAMERNQRLAQVAEDVLALAGLLT